jgi:2,3-bisphosphoglycerate-dependent phosphoglycerate mutase
MAGKLILARHHQSEYNKEGRWTGLHDPHLDAYGAMKSREMGSLIQDFDIHHAFTSALTRTKETLRHMLGSGVCATHHAPELNERDYGELTGKNKWEVQAAIGEEAFKTLRRSWDHPMPGGESLRMVYERAMPFYTGTIVPHVMSENNVLIVGHGNTLRALIKHIESISDEDIAGVEMPFGAVYIYVIDSQGWMLEKEIRRIDSEVPA